ncbi:MAG: glycosyltransferase [Bacteroidota bacterium]|nr:glycosyltransferase [Bacteroidota bacterium]
MKLTEYLQHWENIIFAAFILITFIQLSYYLFLFTRLAFHKTSPKNISQIHPVSVIICARDEAANLAKNLPGVLIQQYQTTHEVIVVNDNSFDESKYIIEAYQKEHRQLQLVELKQEARFIPGKKFPLSIGIKTAKHEIVLLTDADCVPASEFWIEKMQEGFGTETEIVLGHGALHKKKGFFNKLVRWENLHTALQYFSYAKAGLTYMGVGRNLSYKKAIFFRHKGFSSHNHIPGGDDDLFINKAATKINTGIVIDKDAFTLSEPAKNWKQWVKQKKRHYTTSKYYKLRHKFLLGLYAFSHFLFYPFFVASALFYSWKEALVIFAIRCIVQGIVLFNVSEKLNEKDLFPIYWLLDIWMFFYYIIFSGALFKKPAKTWN